ncbi:MAG: hypothetical protein OEP95_02260 [Myxococcales bacterium]|nr:hypothetical protein [Myxococcales bacterium]
MSTKPLPSFEKQLLLALLVIAAIALAGTLAILPYRLYERDIRNAQLDAHRTSGLVQAAVGLALTQGEDVEGLLERLRSISNWGIRLEGLPSETPPPSEGWGRGRSEIDGTILTYVAPPVRDAAGGLWRLEMQHDIANLKRDSVRLIVDLLIAGGIGAAGFSIAIFLLVRGGLLRPMRHITDELERAAEDGGDPNLPPASSRELAAFREAAHRLAHPGA